MSHGQEVPADAAEVTREEWRAMLDTLPDPFRKFINVLDVLDNKPLDFSRFPGLPESSIDGANNILREKGFPFQLTGDWNGMYLVRI